MDGVEVYIRGIDCLTCMYKAVERKYKNFKESIKSIRYKISWKLEGKYKFSCEEKNEKKVI